VLFLIGFQLTFARLGNPKATSVGHCKALITITNYTAVKMAYSSCLITKRLDTQNSLFYTELRDKNIITIYIPVHNIYLQCIMYSA